jgi:hypothetical protein
MTFREAIRMVREKRNVRPNLGFERQLKLYEKQIFATPDSQTGKKASSAKNPEQQRNTEYSSVQNSQLGKVLNEYLRFQQEPRTAKEGQRRCMVVERRFPFLHSESRQREKPRVRVRPASK